MLLFDRNKFNGCISKIRDLKPLVFHLTNLVAMQEQAHVTLAFGGRPLMSDSHEESEELVSIAQALLLNIGTPNEEQMKAMTIALLSAKNKGTPSLLDPVGYGASRIRNEAVEKLLSTGGIKILKGNCGEIAALGGRFDCVSGVDSMLGFSNEFLDIVVQMAKEKNIVIAATGKVDCISDGKNTAILKGGSEYLSMITGSGCMTGSLVSCFLGSGMDSFLSAIAGIHVMKIAGEKASDKVSGPGTFFAKLLDAIYTLTEKDMLEHGEIQWI